ncbi:hypothetical protein FE840_011340 [Peteryoungia desertarenae]|uniref:Uncharacterized protein n=1 Tax=Peteryoungia desertarenae TaxID=1813451 RepID=A0ABX6QNB8_9HYPH|nr:hypothetical protein [Peteryoungia desertarenae]QLF70084.1 hypothetical protein FE840_011340 [Peteryoungia desertarenae]
MKKIIACLAILAAATPAGAISRYNSLEMTCDEARARVIDEGAVILRYPSTRVTGLTLYDRYVTRNAQCSAHEYAARAYIPTRDSARCPVLNCQPFDPEDRFMRSKPFIPF